MLPYHYFNVNESDWPTFSLEFMILMNNLIVTLHDDIIINTCVTGGGIIYFWMQKLIISANTRLTDSLHTHVRLVFPFIWLLCGCFCPVVCQKNEVRKVCVVGMRPCHTPSQSHWGSWKKNTFSLQFKDSGSEESKFYSQCTTFLWQRQFAVMLL